MANEKPKRVIDEALVLVEDDLKTAERELSRIEAEKAALESRVANLRQTAIGLRQYAANFDALRTGGPTLPMDLGDITPTDGHRPRPRTHAQSLTTILEEHDGPMTLRQLADQLSARDWIAPEVQNVVEIVRGTMRKVEASDPRVELVAKNPIAYELHKQGGSS